MDHGNVCPNPWCTCDPCRCPQPCTCGLRATAHGEETRWDANTSTLHHVVTTSYRRRPSADRVGAEQAEAERAGAGADPHRHAAAGPGLSMVASDDVAAALASDDAEALAAYTRQIVASEQAGQGHEGHTSIRRATHLGHDIEIHTSYRVMVDGRELVGHVGVDDDGITHYHGLPNHQEASAVDLVERIVEQFPTDFPPRDGGEH